ncbi:GntR family transcriptional regulator [Acidipropionibacterium jensenii]|uniref:GntR family transcriptional regulator n=1 Tax=Acidipropionibacterium jensenii TaxID=1749 RepID=A0A3Q9UHW9_9ACTN|nr:GntR family transcriptional regulator [Acidipropionibacterium jensenii]AZZ38561.1 GntR family transcriptional regulator [Acidipropionibacterium jensenii]
MNSADLAGLKVQIKPTSALVYDRLRELVLSGSFGPGEQLNEARLAAAIGVSRGPVREALQRLIADGLLVSIRNRGVFVVELGVDDIKDIYFMRRVLESEAFLQLQERHTPELVDQLRGIMYRMGRSVQSADWHRVALDDMDFHRTVIAAVGSPRMSETFGVLLAQSTICVMNLRTAYPEPQSLVDEHDRLVSLMQQGDPEPLMQEVAWHMSSATDRLTELLGAEGRTHESRV